MRIMLMVLALAAAAPSTAAPPSPAERARLAQRAATITITRDRLGIAHVRGPRDSDAVFGIAYAQAEDDFHRVETNYLTALGRLAEAEGESALWSDVRQRLWVDHDDLKARYAASPAWLRAIMDGWADGLNHYLATHPDVRPRAMTHFEPWMALSFTEGSIGGDIENVDLAALKALYADGRAKAVAIRAFAEPQGSNGIAIGRSKSASGNALLLINPHTSFFFRDVVHVTSGEGLNAYGAVTWGQPFIYQGFNEKAGWMHTSSGLDNRDDFAVRLARLPNGRDGYRFGRAIRPLGRKIVTVQVRQADGTLAARTIPTWFTVHGPVVRAEPGKLVSYAIMYEPVRALEQSFRRTKAHTLQQFMAVSALRANSSNNTLFADSSGNIAYLHPQFVPVRDPRVDYRGTVDGSDPRTAWRGLHAVASLPNAINPASGFAYNSNDAPWSAAGAGTFDPARFPAYIDQWGLNARSRHALDLLANDRKVTAAGLRDIAYDTANPGFDQILPQLVADFDRLPRGDARRARLAGPVALLRGWDRRWSVESAALSLAVHWGEEFWDAVMAKDRPTDVNEVAYARMSGATPDVRLSALERAMATMTGRYGSWRVPWGTINRYQRNDRAIAQRFDDRKPSLAVAFPEARWGSLASFVTVRTDTAKRYGVRGNSFVAVVEFTPDGPRAKAVTTGGVNGDPRSPHFRDQAQAYVDGILLSVAFTPAEIDAQAVERYRPGDRRR